MPLHFSRDTKIYIELDDGTPTSWLVPVLDGFSFSQNINTTEITLNEAGTTSRRSRLLFNDSLAPIEWSFATYARPFVSNGTVYVVGTVRCVEEVLWGMFSGANNYVDGTGVWAGAIGNPIVHSASPQLTTINLDSSNISAMPAVFNIYFSLSDGLGIQTVYKVTQAVVNSVTIDFDIDGLATFTWSGFGAALVDQTGFSPDIPAGYYTEGTTSTSAFIRNRLSDVTLTRTDVSPTQAYTLVLTGGSITLENNLTYLTPEELGIVNAPLGNVTGPRSITGNLTAYLDTATNGTADLLADLAADTTTVRNVFDMSIFVGGNASGTPNIEFSMPTAHLIIPVITVEDVLSVDVGFDAQVQDGNVDNTNEATIIYRVA
jgi:hypothetical protein